MAKFHVNPATGEAGECSAKNGNCPFGGEDSHYTSKEAARASYESSKSTFPAAPKKVIGLQEMNALAKVTNDPEQIQQFIEVGSERTLANLAKNPNLTAAHENAILDKTSILATRIAVFEKKIDGDYSRMTPDEAEELLYRQLRVSKQIPYGLYGKEYDFLAGPHLDGRTYDRLIASHRLPASVKSGLTRLLALNNRIPAHRLRAHLDNTGWKISYGLHTTALVNSKLTKRDLLDAPKEFLDSYAILPPNFTQREVDMLADVAATREHDYLASFVARDSRVSNDALLDLRKIAPEDVYANPNASKGLRAMIAQEHPNEPFVRVGKLKEKLGSADFDKLVASRSSRSLSSRGTYNETTIKFDKDLVAKYGLTKDDLLYIGQARRYNAGVSYDEETATLTMNLDTSD